MFIPGHFEEVSNATLKFQEEVKDPKASIIPTFNYVMGSVRTHLRACICLSVDLTATGPSLLSRCSCSTMDPILLRDISTIS